MRFINYILLITLSISGNLYSQQNVSRLREQTQLQQQLQETSASRTDETPELELEEIPYITESEKDDLGPQFLLAVKPRARWVNGSVDSQFYYTTNKNYSEPNISGTGLDDTYVWVNKIDIAFAPDPWQIAGNALQYRLGFRNQWFNYNLDSHDSPDHRNLDFQIQSVFTDLTYQFLESWYAGVSFDWSRYIADDQLNTASGGIEDYQEFYREYIIGWYAGKSIPLTGNASLSLSYNGSYVFTDQMSALVTDPDQLDRVTNSLLVSLSWIPLEKLDSFIIQPYVQTTVSHYARYFDTVNQSIRTDLDISTGASLYYLFSSWGNVRIFASYDERSTNVQTAVPNYRVINSGIGLNLFHRF